MTLLAHRQVGVGVNGDIATSPSGVNDTHNSAPYPAMAISLLYYIISLFGVAGGGGGKGKINKSKKILMALFFSFFCNYALYIVAVVVSIMGRD